MMPRSTDKRRRKAGGAPSYLRRRGFADKLSVRFAARAGAVAFLAAVLMHSLDRGGYFNDPRSPFFNMEGRMAGVIGQAAERIQVHGLTHHSARSVIAAIGIESGGSMLGFSPEKARRLLENLDWVKSARLAKIYPNILRIGIVEREPIALWQTAGDFYPVDAEGAAIASLDPGRFSGLPIVTGEGANEAAKELVNHLAAHPRIKSALRAAARVGKRRWNFYFASGLKVLMPEHGAKAALARLEALDARFDVLSRALETLDLRHPGRLVMKPADQTGS
ncbi:MAG TPA: FtsQ-type POTRA domain-containing protein [Thermopetrobacter sp.]|nr:FtsQ-type POTRA domain-containing protein [Thermopetrobacter sp.]